jgi:hypothetical protein
MSTLWCIVRKSFQFRDSELNQRVALVASAHVAIDALCRNAVSRLSPALAEM